MKRKNKVPNELREQVAEQIASYYAVNMSVSDVVNYLMYGKALCGLPDKALLNEYKLIYDLTIDHDLVNKFEVKLKKKRKHG